MPLRKVHELAFLWFVWFAGVTPELSSVFETVLSETVFGPFPNGNGRCFLKVSRTVSPRFSSVNQRVSNAALANAAPKSHNRNR